MHSIFESLALAVGTALSRQAVLRPLKMLGGRHLGANLPKRISSHSSPAACLPFKSVLNGKAFPIFLSTPSLHVEVSSFSSPATEWPQQEDMKKKAHM